MQNWFKNAAAYRHPKIFITLLLGFASGLPFLLTLATLHAWLAETGINKTTIGLFVLVTIPYSLKFVWAPVIDHFRLPGLSQVLGKRRSWMLTSQIVLMLSLLTLGATHPEQDIMITAAAAFMVAFASATQDIIIEAYRVESLSSNLLGPGASASSLGYRLGMWVSGAGALYLASLFSWFTVYMIMAGCVSVGILTTLLSPEPNHKISNTISLYPSLLNTSQLFWHQMRRQFRTSFQTMIRRQDIKMILLFICFYKIGDTVLNTMTMPFLLEIGFSKWEIAHVAKSFGIGAMIIGGLTGGLYLTRGSLSWALTIAAALQIVASLMFWVQASVGHNLGVLFITIGIENFAAGLGNAAFIVYLSSRCRMPHTATHYALLTSFGSFCRVAFSSLAGWTADRLSWTEFYSLVALLCLALLFLTLLKASAFEYEHEEDEAISPEHPAKAAHL